MLGACRSRTPPARAVDWKSATAEAAALLLVDQDGALSLVCLPGRAPARKLFPGVALRRILDVGWKGGPMVAGWAAPSAGAHEGDELVLLAPHAIPRRPAKDVRSARFSPDGAALAYEVVRRGNSAEVSPPTSYVLDLNTTKLSELAALADPMWEADGRHLRGTRLGTPNEQRQGLTAAQWSSLRARWDRESGATTIAGRGSAQIPAPVGAGVAWTENQRSAIAPSHCGVLLAPRGGIHHTVVGPFCMGTADDRGVRWSPDGKWLAFPRPGPVPGERKPGRFFIDVVGIEGGRSPVVAAFYDRVGPAPLAIAVAPGTVWFDWSPSQRFLAIQDGADDLRVYDFEAQGIAVLGKGQRPMWSPGSAYLVILAAGQGAATSGIKPSQDAGDSATEAFVLSGASPEARIDLGSARDVRWLSAQACESP
jgi:hypothetical protein